MKEVVGGRRRSPYDPTGKGSGPDLSGQASDRPHWKLNSPLVPPPKRLYLGLRGGPIYSASPKSGQGPKRWDFLSTNPIVMDIREHGF